jgi:hypothetical protein
MAYLTPKLLLFVLHAVLGSVGFYLTLFYRQYLQLSLTAVGIAAAISAFGNLLAGPVWTIVIERWPARHGQLLAVLMLIGTMAIVALRLTVDLIDNQLWFLASCISAALYGIFALPCCALADYAVLKILGSNSILYGRQNLLDSSRFFLEFAQIHSTQTQSVNNRKPSRLWLCVQGCLFLTCWPFDRSHNEWF